MSIFLMKASLAPSTRKAYKRCWVRFEQFCDFNFAENHFPASSKMVSHFIAYIPIIFLIKYSRHFLFS